MIYIIEEIKKCVLPIIQKYNIPAMCLFGSYSRGETMEESDLEDIFQQETDLITMRSVVNVNEFLYR